MDQAERIERVALIGERGRMGRMIAARAAEAGCAVTGVDLPLASGPLAEAVAEADLVLLCVPAPAVADVVAAVRGVVAGSAVLADICSVKVRPLREMMEGFGGPVVGTHPLFGPAPAPGLELRVAVTPGRGQGAAEQVEAWLARIGFAPFRTTAEKHDQALALIQGLNFVTQLAYLATAADHPEIREFVTPSFERRLDSARKMVIEDGEMFKAIFEANPFSQEAVRGFRSHLNLAAGGDVDLLLDKAAWWWRSSE